MPDREFVTLGGAAVILTPHGAWSCRGCGARGSQTLQDAAREQANTHAGQCRSTSRRPHR